MTFEPGTRIRTHAQRPSGHTRLPAYLQLKNGIVRGVIGEFPLPDENACDPAHARICRLYSVEFNAADVWGGTNDGKIYADLFEDYLEDAQ